jgi:hypothetical protein
MYLDIMPYSFELAPSKMFITGKAKYRFTDEKDSPTGLMAKLLPSEAAAEFRDAAEAVICFKSPVLLEQYEAGVLNLFYTKIFEPTVEDKPGEIRETEPTIESAETPEQVVDKALRISRCEALATDIAIKTYEVWRYEVEV